jgi:hypothetical protein
VAEWGLEFPPQSQEFALTTKTLIMTNMNMHPGPQRLDHGQPRHPLHRYLSQVLAGHLIFPLLLLLFALPAVAADSGDTGTGGQCDALPSTPWSGLIANPEPCKLHPEANPKANITHAETYLWLGMLERGDRRSFRCGLQYLNAADASLDKNPADHQPPDDQQMVDKQGLKQQIQALRDDLNHQLEQTSDTLYGRFPLSRLLVPTLFLDWESTATYDLIDHADDVAVRLGTNTLIEQVLEHWTATAQIPVVIDSVPKNPGLENEALYVIDRHPKLFPYLERQWAPVVVGQLGDQAEPSIAPLLTKPPGAAIYRALAKEIGHPQPLILSIQEQDCVDENYRFLLTGQVWATDGSRVTEQISAFGLARGRHHQLLDIVIAHGLLLTLTLLAVLVLETRHHRKCPPVWRLLGLTLVAFGVGRTIPWMVIPGLHTIMPDPEAVLWASAWWPFLVGITLFTVPIAAYRLIAIRLPTSLQALRMAGRGGAVGIAIALGVVAYLSVPALTYLRAEAWPYLLLLTLAGTVSGWWLGHILDRVTGYPLRHTMLVLPLTGAVGAAFLSTRLDFLLIAVILLVVVVIMVALWEALHTDKHDKQPANGPSPKDRDALFQASLAPSFQATAGFTRVLQQLGKPSEPGQNPRLFTPYVLTSRRAGGKSAALRSLARLCHTDHQESIEHRLLELDIDTQQHDSLAAWLLSATLLSGSCPDHDTGRPYAPFMELLLPIMPGVVKALQEQGNSDTEAAIGGAIGILIHAIGGVGGLGDPERAHRDALHREILRALRSRPQDHPLIITIDDIQELDQPSTDLLVFLLNAPREDSAAMTLIMTSSDDSPRLNALKIKEHCKIPLEEPGNSDAMANILRDDLLLHPKVRSWLAEQVLANGSHHSGPVTEIFYALELVRELIRVDALERPQGQEQWQFRDNTNLQRIRVPTDLDDLYAYRLNALQEHFELLAWAAALGIEFHVEVLADALRRHAHDVIRDLDHIATRAGLVYDRTDKPGIYRFENREVRQLLKARYGITARGPGDNTTPERARNCHARLARVLEDKHQAHHTHIGDIARQYYAAGGSGENLARARAWCLRAAWSALGQYDFPDGQQFIEYARDCATAEGMPREAEEALLQLEMEYAHRSGRNAGAVAHHSWQYFRRQRQYASLDSLLAITRSCYEAHQSQRALEVARMALRMAREQQDDYRIAEANQFIALNQPPEHYEDSRKRLLYALELTNSAATSDNDLKHDDRLAGLRQRARLLDSLGNLLTQRAEAIMENNAEQAASLLEEAKEYLLQSLRIKSSRMIKDRGGMARSFGNLGRLTMLRATMSEAPGEHQRYLGQAQRWFEKDLTLSCRIGDQRGQVLMHSTLGEVALAWPDPVRASRHYHSSLEGAELIGDRCFALIGLLAAAVQIGPEDGKQQWQQAEQALLSLGKNAPKGLPVACREKLQQLGNSEKRFEDLADKLCKS